MGLKRGDIVEEIDEQLWARFQALRERIQSFVRALVKDGAFHKSYEGKMEVSFCYPSCFDSKGSVRIHLWCYLICPEREHEWEAETFQKALIQAERDIYRWIEE